MAKKLMTIPEFATIKKVSSTAVYHAVYAGKIKVEKIGKHKFLDYNKYEDYKFKEFKERVIDG